MTITRSKRHRIFNAYASGMRVDKICQRYKINPQILTELRDRHGWDEIIEKEKLELRDQLAQELRANQDKILEGLSIIIANYILKAKQDKISTPEVSQFVNAVSAYFKALGKSIDDEDLNLDKVLRAIDKAKVNLEKGESKKSEEPSALAKVLLEQKKII